MQTEIDVWLSRSGQEIELVDCRTRQPKGWLSINVKRDDSECGLTFFGTEAQLDELIDRIAALRREPVPA